MIVVTLDLGFPELTFLLQEIPNQYGALCSTYPKTVLVPYATSKYPLLKTDKVKRYTFSERDKTPGNTDLAPPNIDPGTTKRIEQMVQLLNDNVLADFTENYADFEIILGKVARTLSSAVKIQSIEFDKVICEIC